ncbi:uncharacterized protein FTOL_13589 [Fusarium torulosum]|uniref:Uncharacterized protein n=1 Tax=Fusarium torulosum TaxID=33205 RepID=A0AAE8SQ23_9HYPO|nr:uncharacterized protein FTOL_13589 [Fusarium torulosum]
MDLIYYPAYILVKFVISNLGY